jgi:hypothetical protein
MVLQVHNTNVAARKSQVVKIAWAPTETDTQGSGITRVVMFARGRIGVQYRMFSELPPKVRQALRVKGVKEIYVVAYLNSRNGRWSIPDREPVKGW